MKCFFRNRIVFSTVTVFLSVGLCLSPLISAEIVQAESPPTITTFAGFNIPYAICFDGANIWVTNRYISTVTKLRASDGMVVGTYNVGSEPMGICFDGANIWVTNSGSNNATKLRASDGTTLGTYNTDTPWGICSDGSSIWIANRYSNTVSKLRASDGTVLGIYNVGSEPWGICSDGSSIWVSNWVSNNVTKLRASDGAILGTYNVGTQPTGICFAGSNIWVANWGSNNVTKLRANDGSVIGTYPVGSYSHFICFDDTNIWVANYGSNNVTKLRASDGRVIDTYDVSTPVGICFDGANIWVTNYNGATVSKLSAISASESSTKAPESPPKIDWPSAPQIPPNVLPIIIISCVIALLVLLFTFSHKGSKARKRFWGFILLLAFVSFIGYLFWIYGIPVISNWFRQNLGAILILVALTIVAILVWRFRRHWPKVRLSIQKIFYGYGKYPSKERLIKMGGPGFEYFIEDLLMKNGWRIIQSHGGSGDRGLDIIAERTEKMVGKIQLYIQCKNLGTPARGEYVRNLNGSLPANRAGVKGVLICPSGFTKQAMDEANDHKIDLWDYQYICDLIKSSES